MNTRTLLAFLIRLPLFRADMIKKYGENTVTQILRRDPDCKNCGGDRKEAQRFLDARTEDEKRLIQKSIGRCNHAKPSLRSELDAMKRRIAALEQRLEKKK